MGAANRPCVRIRIKAIKAGFDRRRSKPVSRIEENDEFTGNFLQSAALGIRSIRILLPMDDDPRESSRNTLRIFICHTS
jgi:hypothetical protein